MTQAPEVALARELGLCYAELAMVTDRDAGEASATSLGVPVKMEAVFERLKAMAATTRRLINQAVPMIEATPVACGCSEMAPDPALPMGDA